MGKCYVCDTIIQGRSDAKFCSNACKQKAYRNRKKTPLNQQPNKDNYLAMLRAYYYYRYLSLL